MDLNTTLKTFLTKTLWIWLPFFAVYALTKELILKISGEEKK